MANHHRNGKVYLVGGGPGDPELLTLKAHKVLQSSDVIIYDALINPEVLKYAHPKAQLIFIGKSRSKERLSQKAVERLMILHAKQGKTVARLKGGDPFIFGRGGEEVEALAEAGIKWEVVPGISAGHALPAYAGIPLTHRNYAANVAFITGHEAANKNSSIDWEKLATAIDTLVIFMGAKNLPQIISRLVMAGRAPSTPIAIIERGTLADQRIRISTLATTLATLIDDPIQTPALIIIGEVVKLREQLSSEYKPFEINKLWKRKVSSAGVLVESIID